MENKKGNVLNKDEKALPRVRTVRLIYGGLAAVYFIV
ncbi:hypothetical protein J2Y67_001662 [Neobacillus niacini]|nr:hypothetical protein [Neobacillus niacini]